MTIKSGFDYEVTLINPSKQVKGFSNIGFYEFCIDVVNTNSFSKWSIENENEAWVSKLDLKIKQHVVEEFLTSKGYKITKRSKDDK